MWDLIFVGNGNSSKSRERTDYSINDVRTSGWPRRKIKPIPYTLDVGLLTNLKTRS